MAHDVKNHDYHLVDPSPWPVITSLGAFITALGAILAMQDVTMLVLAVGALIVCYALAAWWRDVSLEAHAQGHHTPVVQLHHRYGVMLFILSEVMFFVAWFWAYFDAALFANDVKQYARVELFGGVWPPEGIETFIPWDLPLINTLILLLSGTTVTWAHHALIEDNRSDLKFSLWLTVGLGVLFTIFQGIEYSHALFGFSEHLYGASFFMATGFHGFHVIVGTIFLFVCLMRAYSGHFAPNHHFGFEAAAWYWHFVDVVWLILFAVIYVWGA